MSSFQFLYAVIAEYAACAQTLWGDMMPLGIFYMKKIVRHPIELVFLFRNKQYSNSCGFHAYHNMLVFIYNEAYATDLAQQKQKQVSAVCGCTL